MLIQGLCDYYDLLEKKEKLPPKGYSPVNISYLVCLTPEGKIDEIINRQKTIQVPSGKDKTKDKLVPVSMFLPKRTQKPGIDSNVIEHRPLYLFGLNLVGTILTPEDRTNKAKKSHGAFVKTNLAFLEGLTSPVACAYRAFIQHWVPENEAENPFLLQLGKSYAGAGYVFCLSGHPEHLLHEDPEVKKRAEAASEESTDEDAVFSQCSVTGKIAPIARIHEKIKGVSGGLTTGGVLVGFNSSAEESYGRQQSYNSDISQAAMEKYTQALNTLLSDKKHTVVLDTNTVVFWAISDNPNNDDLMQQLLNQRTDALNEEQTNTVLTSLMQDAREGTVISQRLAVQHHVDPNVVFYLAGLKPNSSRLAVKFVYRKVFGDLLFNIAQHQNDLQMSAKDRPIPLWLIKRELISPKAKHEEVDPALLARLFDAMINGTDYPAYLLSTMVRRVKTDTDRDISNVRAGVIKACLNRKARKANQKEEITLSLNQNNQNPAYLCGRLFAVLEKLQQDAANQTLNRTIKDAYFASAAAKPALVFPRLIQLAQHHITKLSAGGGSQKFYHILMGEITNGLQDEFPDTLPLKGQGTFIIGYYQQRQDFYTKKENKQNKQENE